MDKVNEIPEELIEAARKNNLFPFVGAGLSFQFKNIKNQLIRDWINLNRQIILLFSEKGYDVSDILNRIEKLELARKENKKPDEQPIDILKSVEQDSRFSKQEIMRHIVDFYHLSQDNDYSLQKKICRLSNTIVTTNYDNAFEIASPNLNTVFFGNNDKVDLLIEHNKSIIFKLHGSCLDVNNKLILFPSDYSKLYDGIRTSDKNIDTKHILLSFHKLVINKSMLFLGCGMGDFQINNIFLGIRQVLKEQNQKHFIIIERDKFRGELKNFLVPIFIEKVGDGYDYSIINSIVEKLIIEKENNIEFRKNYEKAKEQLECEKELTKKDSLTLTMKALELFLHRDFAKSIQCFKDAIKLNSDNCYTLNSFGFVLFEIAKTINDKDISFESIMLDSIEHYKKAIEINPEFTDALNNLGVILADLAERGKDETLFIQANENHEKATQINTEYDAENFYNWGNTLFSWAEMNQDEKLFKQAFEKYKRATSIDIEHASAFCNWGLALANLANIKQDEILFKQAFEKYEKASQFETKDDDVFYNWGNALYQLAEMKQDEALFIQAFEKYEKASRINPVYADVFYSYGNALYQLANMKQDEALFKQAFEKYEKATLINIEYVDAFHNWGLALYSLAEMQKDERIYEQSCEKYKKVIQINPEDAEAFYDWGNALSDLANIKQDETLFKQTFEKYERATQINSEYADAFHNWGLALANLASMKQDETLLLQAAEKYEKADQIGQ